MGLITVKGLFEGKLKSFSRETKAAAQSFEPSWLDQKLTVPVSLDPAIIHLRQKSFVPFGNNIIGRYESRSMDLHRLQVMNGREPVQLDVAHTDQTIRMLRQLANTIFNFLTTCHVCAIPECCVPAMVTANIANAVAYMDKHERMVEDVNVLALIENVRKTYSSLDFQASSLVSRGVGGLDMGKKIYQFTASFLTLQTQLKPPERTSVPPAFVSYRSLCALSDTRRDQILSTLRTAIMDPAGREPCFPGTRRQLLRNLVTWGLMMSDGNVRFIYGMSGSGKSTTVRPHDVIRSLAAHLAAFDTHIAEAIAAQITENPNATEGPLLQQFDELLKKPLWSVDDNVSTPDGPALTLEWTILVVIDGLDQCGTPEDRKDLVAVLADQLEILPRWIRFIITSRPESNLRAKFRRVTYMTLDHNDVDTKDEVAACVRDRMEAIRMKNLSLDMATDGPDWPGEDMLDKLSRRAQGQFAWAKIACAFIDLSSPPDRLRAVIDDSNAPIHVLHQSFTDYLCSPHNEGRM
ncbi:hypothetical protein EUX98_g3110 [Antrodiella citrinella]|uniref:Nephrocystin 3-like N-terminal domain-containing protein n=1 Tax=Antrodiella citrinella TaxID=2447956 RepID=A0A4S4MYM8_9APHY|nr:hypothetical protein EUX98_g3110 [Antrodiella citrinella]